MDLHESAEMYLETIYILALKSNSVRSIDVAESMGYSKPSVSRAVGLLKSQDYICVDKNGYITLTEIGKKKAESIFERHTVLTNLLTIIGVEKQTASEDACRIEHVISDETFDAIKKYSDKLNIK